MEKHIIKVGFCVAYDWELLKKSVPRIYEHADTICFSLDKGRRSWSGLKFNFDEKAFLSWLTEIDTQNKIKLYEDNFSVAHFSSIENDNHQRTLMSEYMGAGGWHIQVDSDEYFFDFKGFKQYLLSLIANPTGREKAINVSCNWISLIKRTTKGYLYVNNGINKYETMPFATNVPEYTWARRNSHFEHVCPFFVLHETWARGEAELAQKLNSWGHDNDLLSKESYLHIWKVLDEYNYRYMKNLHPINGEAWKQLGYVPEQDINKVIEWLKQNGNLKVEKSYLIHRNSRIVQGLKQRLKGQ